MQTPKLLILTHFYWNMSLIPSHLNPLRKIFWISEQWNTLVVILSIKRKSFYNAIGSSVQSARFFKLSPNIGKFWTNYICLTLFWQCVRDLSVHKFRVGSVFPGSLAVEMEAFVVKISASLLIIVLITSHNVAEKLSMESKIGKRQTIC